MPRKALREILREFCGSFTSLPTFDNFTTLLCGWILCTGRHTISRVIQAAGAENEKSYSTYYRFFSQAVWESDALGRVLVSMLLRLQQGPRLTAIVDDTLSRRRGPHVWGAGFHHDPVSSTYGGEDGPTVRFACGHCWVVLCLWVPLPWNADRGLAIPVFWRLYRQKKRCPAETYRKKTELANELIAQLLAVVPVAYNFLLVGDGDYACSTVVQKLPPRVTFIGPAVKDAALFAPPPRRTGNVGRPRKMGARLPSPEQLAADKSVRWKKASVRIYGREVELLVKTQTCLWWTVAGQRLVKVVLTRDPKGRIEDRTYFTTDPGQEVHEILGVFSRRWSQEVMHRDVKQHLGLEDPQNGWWRNPRGQRRNQRVPGPQPHEHRGEKAARRTAPLAFVVYAIVAIWYLEHGSPSADVRRARARAPWYLQKVAPSVGDMLEAARRDLWAERISKIATLRALPEKAAALVSGWLAAV